MRATNTAKAAAQWPDLHHNSREWQGGQNPRKRHQRARRTAVHIVPDGSALAAAIERVQHLAAMQSPRADAREIWVGGQRFKR